MADYALITAHALDLTDLYTEVVQGEGLEAVIVHDSNEAKRIVSTRGSPKLVIADLEMARDSSFKLLREVQDSIAPDDRPAVLASVSRELRTTAGDLTDALGIAEVVPRGADARTIGSAVRRALSKRPSAVPFSYVPPPAEDAAQLGLAACAAMGLLDDSRRDKELENLAAQIAEAFGAPIALVSVTLDDRRWFKAHLAIRTGHGESRSAARDSSFCTHVIQSGHPIFVSDATVHPIFSSHPLVRRGLVASFAGAPMTTSDGEVLGALCLLDTRPAAMDAARVDLLARLARRVGSEFELRSKARSSALEVIRLTEKLAQERQRHRISKNWLSQLEGALSRLGTGVFVADEEGRIVCANAAAAELLRVPLEKMLGMHLEELLHACERFFEDARGSPRPTSAPRDEAFSFCREVVLDGPVKRRLKWSIEPIAWCDGTGHLSILTGLDLKPPPSSRRRYAAEPAARRGARVRKRKD